MSEMQRRAPSEILDINDPYTAWCLDEAATYINAQIKRHKKPKWHRERAGGDNQKVLSALLMSGMATHARASERAGTPD